MARIMVVDDSHMIRKALRLYLEGGNHEIVAEASDGEDAVKAYAKFKPDLVTMDIAMPEMTGIEALGLIMEMDSEAKVVMVSSINEKDLVVKAIELGAKSFVLKPMSREKTLQVIDEVLAK
ncbi:MAG: response regulator [Bacteroidetes bacterium]|nr:response regulator [Bacteroidota bacterium]